MTVYDFLYIAFCALCFYVGHLAGASKYKGYLRECMEAKTKVINVSE